MSEMMIGFCTGAWDLFHEGHQNAINFCKERCGYLVVGVCSDPYVTKEKGEGRPVDSYTKRWFNVMNAGADKAIGIRGLDIEQILQVSDIWFIGPDQQTRHPYDYIHKILIPRTPGISTTQLINTEV